MVRYGLLCCFAAVRGEVCPVAVSYDMAGMVGCVIVRPSLLGRDTVRLVWVRLILVWIILTEGKNGNYLRF